MNLLRVQNGLELDELERLGGRIRLLAQRRRVVLGVNDDRGRLVQLGPVAQNVVLDVVVVVVVVAADRSVA